jgi:DNA invertase Pin-like site-specific DNA recombinase
MAGKRFVIWRAVSSKKQAEEVSPQVQEEMARQHVAKWGGTVVDVLDVAESRDIVLLEDAAAAIPAYAQLQDYIYRHAVDVLVCYDLSRLGRAHTLILSIVEMCRRAGIMVYELENPPHSLEDRAGYDEMLIRALKSVGYQHEVMKMRDRMRYGREGRAKKGELPQIPPYGYHWQHQQDGSRSVEIDPAAAAVVREIAALYLAGRGQIGIAADLTARGIPTPAGGAMWQKNSVAVILQRAWTYAGYAEYYRKRRSGYIRTRGDWTPIWDEATAERIEQERAARAANRRISDTPSRLTGLVVCEVCGRNMWQVRNEDGEIRDAARDHRRPNVTGATRRRRPKFYCQPYHPGGSVGTDRVIEALAIALDDLAHADLSAIPDDDGDQAAQLDQQLAQHDAAIAKHQQALRRADDAFVAGVMDLDRYKAQVDRLRALIAAEESAKTTLQAAADAAKQRGSRADMLAEIAAAGPAMLTAPDTAAANAWLRRYVRVFVRDNEVTEVRFNFW